MNFVQTNLRRRVAITHIFIRIGGLNLQDELRNQVVAYMDKYNLKRKSLSTYLGISPQYLSDWFHKRVDYDNERIQKIKKFISHEFY